MATVSIIIPTRNRRDLLPRAVESVLRQTFTDYDLIVVDDGSTDGTHALDLWTKHPHIRYLPLPSSAGVSAARNAGVRATQSVWIAFLDSDDQWHPDKLSRQMEWLAARPHYDIMQCCETWIRNGVRVNPPATHRKTGGDIFTASLARCMITPSTVVMRRPLFLSTGGFDESLPACEDYDLWLRICHRHPVGLLDVELAIRYGGHADQLSATVPRLDQYRIIALEKLLAGTSLNVPQRSAAAKTLATKAAQMARGSRKSGNTADCEKYQLIAHRASEET